MARDETQKILRNLLVRMESLTRRVSAGVQGEYRDTLEEMRRLLVESRSALENAEVRTIDSFEGDRAFSVAHDALHSSASGIMITDLEGRIEFINPAFLEMFGYQGREQVLGLRAAQLFENEGIHSLSGVDAFTNRETGETVEFVVHRKNGDKMDVELFSSLVSDRQGKPVGSIASLVDVTERNKSEKSLRETRNLLKKVFDSLDEAVFVVDITSRTIVSCNRAVEKIFGYHPDEVIGQNTEFLHVDREAYEEFGRMLIPALDAEGVLQVDFRMKRRDGSIFYSDHTATAFSDDSGERKGVIGVVRDITKKKLAEEELKKSESRLAEAQRLAKLGNWEWDIAKNRLHWSDEIFHIFGLAPRRFEETFEAFLDAVHPDDRDKVKNEVDLALKERKPYNVEHRVVQADGSIRIVREQGVVTFGANGEPLNMFGTVLDITDLVRAREERERLFTAVESAAEAMVVTDAKGLILYANPAFEQVTGYQSREVLGQDLYVLDTREHDPAFNQELREALERRGVWRGRLVNRKKDGTSFQEDCTVSVVKNGVGEVTNYVAVKRDVTERLRLESLAEAINVADNIGYVFSGIRHEIGNPVNAVRMTLAMLKSRLDKAEDSEASEYIQRCLDELSRVQYLLDNLKSFNLFENPTTREVDLSGFLSKFTSLVKPDMEKRAISLDVSIDSDASVCLADPRALQQVLLNILTNAIEACEKQENPNVSIHVEKESASVRIHVRDNGTGMSTEQLARLFRPFHTTKPKGTGLGLVIAQRMLLKMNGSVEIESEKSRGTDASIRLPSA